MTSSFHRRLESFTIWGCGTVLALIASDAISGTYDAGISPIKPILFVPVALLLCVGVMLLSRPTFCAPALVVLLLPLVRWIDAGILGRFVFSGTASAGMACLRVIMVSVAFWAILSTPAGLRAMRWATLLTLFLVSGSVIAEFLGLGPFTSIPGRYAGFLRHPNTPPIVLCEMIGLIFAFYGNFRLNLLLAAFALPGVALTYGRSGMLIFTFIVGLYILRHARTQLGFLLVSSAIAVPLLAIGIAFLQSNTGEGVTKDKNTSDRMEAIFNLDFEKLKSPERAKDLADAWEGLLEAPLLGHGVGAASVKWVPHNEYIALWMELGVPGLLLFLLIVWGLFFRSLAVGGKGLLAVLGYLIYTPIAQGRVMEPHFYFSLLTIVHLLWPQRYRIVLNHQRKSIHPTTAPSAKSPLPHA